MTKKRITSFDGDYRFLSNFYPCKIKHLGHVFDSVEAAYQASKCDDPFDPEKFVGKNANQAKKLGRRVRLRSDWKKVRLEIMETLLRQKFESPVLRTLLSGTGEAVLIEGNWWGDKYWGVYQGEGQNKLGLLLMKIRSEGSGLIDFKKIAENLGKLHQPDPYLVGGTGHRPDKLFKIAPYSPGALEMLTGFCIEMLQKIEQENQLIEGVISGMALGFDQALALATLHLEKPLICALPCKGQESQWPEHAQARYRRILRRASETWYATLGSYSPTCMHERDKMVVNRSSLVIALFNGDYSGGTSYTVNYAFRLGVPLRNVWPEWEENYG